AARAAVWGTRSWLVLAVGVVVKQVRKRAHAGGEMLRDSRFGDAQAQRDFGPRHALKLAHHDSLPPAMRHAVERGLQFAKFLSRDGGFVGTGFVGGEAQRVEIGDG